MTKCVICDRHPAQDNGSCVNCNAKIEAERKHQNGGKPTHFITYHGHVVGLFPNGDGELRAQLLQRKAEGLPKGKTINLNHYCEGYTRETIKRFKACILQLANC